MMKRSVLEGDAGVAVVLDPDDALMHDIVQSIVEIHIACSEQDGLIGTFLPPWNRQKMQSWYWDRVEEARRGSRKIIVLCLKRDLEAEQTGNNDDGDDKKRGLENDLAGVVMLSYPWTETGPFRASVEKLMVSPDCRRRGIARKLMDKVEEVALADSRVQLLLDTEVGSGAEHVYPRLGYTEFGRLPHYAYSPTDGRMTEGLYFYKLLEDHSMKRVEELSKVQGKNET